jgi:hypothetical protein
MVASLPPSLRAQVIAYSVTSGTVGNQDVGGEALGLDFDVNSAIIVNQLGVFDSGSNGLSRFLTAQLYNRDTQLPVTPLITFSAGSGPSSGTLIDGSRFLDIAPVSLPAGFHGSIVASHFDNVELIFNSFGSTNTTSTLNTGGGLIAFVGGGRISAGLPDVYPTSIDGGPVNRYDAGTFTFTVSAVPEPAGIILAAVAAVCGALVLRRRRSRRRPCSAVRSAGGATVC